MRLLTLFTLISISIPPEHVRKPNVFSGGVEMEHWREKG